jgi:hypothetical protein
LDEKAVSELTGLALSTLRNWRCLKTGPRYCRPGGRAIRYKLQTVLDYMEACAVETEPCAGSCRCAEAGQ